MHFMLLLFIALVCIVVWGFFHANPEGVARGALLACNIVVLLAASAAGITVGLVLHSDASAANTTEKVFAAYLALMAAGTTFLIVVALGGLLRNLVLFPLSRRATVPLHSQSEH